MRHLLATALLCALVSHPAHAAGQLQASFTTMPTASALYQAGKLKPIAVGSPPRRMER